MERSYYLIELHCQNNGPVLYYTAPGHWQNCPDLATKFHDGLAAKIEAGMVRITSAPHEVKVVSHSWGP